MIFRFFILVLFINTISFSQTSEEKKSSTPNQISNSEKSISENKNLKIEINVSISEAILEAGKMNPPMIISVKNTGICALPEGKYTIEVKTIEAPLYASVYDKTLFEFQKDIPLTNLISGGQVEIKSSSFNSPSVEGDYTLQVTIIKEDQNFNAVLSEKTITLTVIE